jgi:hypothetical protein
MATLTGPFSITPQSTAFTAPYYNRPTVFLVGANRYQFCVDTAANPRKIRAFKSTDSGATWTQQDAAGAPSINNLGGGAGLQFPTSCPTYIQDPTDTTKVVAAYVENVTQHVSFVVFDTSSDTWGVPNTGGPVAHGTDTGGADQSNDDTGAKTCLEYRSSDDSYVILYQGPPDNTAGQDFSRPYWVTFDRVGLTWSVEVKVTGGAAEAKHYLADGLIISSDISHLVISSPTNATATTPYEIYHVAIESDDTINAQGLITDQVFRERESNVGYPKLRASASEMMIPFKALLGSPLFGAAVARAALAITPAWTIEAVNDAVGTEPSNSQFNAPSLAIDAAGFPHVFWSGSPNGANVSPGTLMFHTQGGNAGAGWSSPDTLFTTPDPANDYFERVTVSSIGASGIGIVVFFFETAGPTDDVDYFEFLPAPVRRFYSFHIYMQGVKRFKNSECPV